MTRSEIIRVLVAKAGLDGHDRGAKVVARALKEAGMEIIYTGIRQTPQMIAETAFLEEVDVIGISILSGAHLELFPEIFSALKEKGIDDVIVVAGGILQDNDRERLQAMGIAGIFGPGSSTKEIATHIRHVVAERREHLDSK